MLFSLLRLPQSPILFALKKIPDVHIYRGKELIESTRHSDRNHANEREYLILSFKKEKGKKDVLVLTELTLTVL